MAITIHGKEYVTVAERVKMLHDREDLAGTYSIHTQVLCHEPVVVKASVRIGEQTFTGISAANPDKPIEKYSPYEVAETSAIGRALGFAGFGVVDTIASAEEMIKAGAAGAQKRFKTARTIKEHESGENCVRCGESNLMERVSNSSTNPGKTYYYCRSHRGFSHWRVTEATEETAAPDYVRSP